MIFSSDLLAQVVQKNKLCRLTVQKSDKDTFFHPQSFPDTILFSDCSAALQHINHWIAQNKNDGYWSASIDQLSTTDTSVILTCFLGKKFNNIQLVFSKEIEQMLHQFSILDVHNNAVSIAVNKINPLKENIIALCEQSGYPFVSVFLDSVVINDSQISSRLNIQKGPLYHIDSIRLIGKAKLNSSFLQHYLFILNNSIYQKDKISRVDELLSELSFIKILQPSDLTMLGSGAVLNVYANPQKSSQANLLLGFQPDPNNNNKLQLTGDINFQFNNILGNGENMLLKWQQLQYKSPRLNLGFFQPYVFHSSFGLDLLFDFFKKDSNFIQLNTKAGIRFASSPYGSAKLVLQLQQNTLLPGAIDTNAIKLKKKLPDNIDATSTNIGFGYEWSKTDYKWNPRKGDEINFIAFAGIKKIKYNSDIEAISDSSFPYKSLYDALVLNGSQIRVTVKATHYLPLKKNSTIKLSLSGGFYWSPEVFKNDLFQIGGFKSVRGFDEESIYATGYGLLSVEYRNLIARNSYICVFSDAAKCESRYQSASTNYTLLSAGAGIQYETKSGILNIIFAMGKRNDIPFALRQAAKIHLGYVNYF